MNSNLKENFLSALTQMKQLKELQQFNRYEEELQRLQMRLEDDEFRIAVVGEFSSGKSTFINALLGQDLLQHSTEETTATLTRIVNVKKEDPRCKTGTVFLENGETLPLSNFSELKEYTTTNSEKLKVVSEVAGVELYLPILDSDRKLVFVDTPGLNGTADGHRERTVQLIQQAHSCIYLLSRRGLADSDAEFLQYLVQYQKNFLFVQNFIDDFRRSEGEDLNKKLAAQRELLDKTVFAQADGCHYELCGVSALKALASQDPSVQITGGEAPLAPQERAALYEQSKFAELRNILSRMFREDRLDRLQYFDTALAICEWVDSLLGQLERREERVDAVYQASTDRQTVDKLDSLKKKVLENRTRHENYLTNLVKSECGKIERDALKQLRGQIEQLNEKLGAEIHSHNDLNALKKHEKLLSNTIENFVMPVVQGYNENSQLRLQQLYQMLLDRIEEYSDIHTVDLGKKQWSGSIPTDNSSFQLEEGRIGKLKTEIAAKKAEWDKQGQERIRIRAEEKEAQNNRSQIDQRIRAAEDVKFTSLRQLGTRPAATTREESYTAKEYRGGLGILDALCGPKEVTRWREVKDDTAGQKWDEQKAKIENDYVLKKNALTGELGAAQRRLERLRNEQQDTEKKAAALSQKIRKLQESLKSEEAMLKTIQQNAAQQYLNHCKKDLADQVQNYLLGTDGIFEQIKGRGHEMIAQAEETFCSEAIRMYRQAVQQKLAWIEGAIQKRQPEIFHELELLQNCSRELKQLKTKMKEWLS